MGMTVTIIIIIIIIIIINRDIGNAVFCRISVVRGISFRGGKNGLCSRHLLKQLHWLPVEWRIK